MYTIYFTVEGTLNFPLDMLRYDHCFPLTQDDVAAVADALGIYGRARERKTFRIALARNQKTKVEQLTPDRWLSFGWSIDPKSIRIEKRT